MGIPELTPEQNAAAEKMAEALSPVVGASYRMGYDRGMIDGVDICIKTIEGMRKLPIFNEQTAVGAALAGSFDGLIKAMREKQADLNAEEPKTYPEFVKLIEKERGE